MTPQINIAITLLIFGMMWLSITRDLLILEGLMYGTNLKWKATFHINSNYSQAYTLLSEATKSFANLAMKDQPKVYSFVFNNEFKRLSL